MVEPAPRLADLLALQAPSGAFPSQVETPAGRVADESCFVTAQVALLLAALGRSEAATHAHARALDFLETCEDDSLPGAFRFYPQGGSGPRLIDGLPPDADDTALAWMALVAGRRREAREGLVRLAGLLPRLVCGPLRRGDPPFARAPLLRIWFQESDPGPVDLTVNLNVLAALGACGAGRSGCGLTALMPRLAGRISAAFAPHAPTRSAMRVLSPFYADPAELAIAALRARACGAAGLDGMAASLAPVDARDRAARRPQDRPLYCNAHGRPLWRAPALQLARQLADRASTPFDLSLSPARFSGGFHDCDAQVRFC